MKENGFTLNKAISRRNSKQTITDADHVEDIAILANTPTQAESLMHSLEQVASGIGFKVNTDKTEYTCFNKKGDVSISNNASLKLVDKFKYLDSSVSSTENNMSVWRAKALTVIDRLSIIWKSKFFRKIKRNFFTATVTLILQYGCTTSTLTKRIEKTLEGNCTGMLQGILKKNRK